MKEPQVDPLRTVRVKYAVKRMAQRERKPKAKRKSYRVTDQLEALVSGEIVSSVKRS